MNKVCPVCEAINSPRALVCVHCGSTFTSGRTLRVDVPVSENDIAEIDLDHAYRDSIVFFVNGDDTPVIIPKRIGRITIGRVVPGSESPTLDLMDYGAGMLGVSRIHASIEQVGHSITLVDLHSTNGTWLNKNRLYPNAPTAIRPGDIIRLGELSMTIFFHMEATDEQTLIFATHPTTSVSPKYLSNQINTLLSALGDLQRIVDQAMNTPRMDMAVNAIVVAKHQQTISVSVENIPDAAFLFEKVIEPWKTMNAESIQQRSEDLKRAQEHLVHDLIYVIDADRPEGEWQPLTEKLMPVLQGIIFSPISLKQTDSHQEHFP